MGAGEEDEDEKDEEAQTSSFLKYFVVLRNIAAHCRCIQGACLGRLSLQTVLSCYLGRLS